MLSLHEADRAFDTAEEAVRADAVGVREVLVQAGLVYYRVRLLPSR